MNKKHFISPDSDLTARGRAASDLPVIVTAQADYTAAIPSEIWLGNLSGSEVYRYYLERLPDLRLTAGQYWLGTCPLHLSGQTNFLVDSTSGFWFCLPSEAPG